MSLVLSPDVRPDQGVLTALINRNHTAVLDVLQLCSRAEARVMIGILVRRREQTENEVVQ